MTQKTPEEIEMLTPEWRAAEIVRDCYRINIDAIDEKAAKVAIAKAIRDAEERSAARIEELEAALKPFVAIVPSSFFAPDGSENEGYVAYLYDEEKPRCWMKGDVHFTGGDLARARAAFGAPKEASKDDPLNSHHA